VQNPLAANSAARAPAVVVTGGNRGIGYAVAAQFAQRGYRVVLVARDKGRGQQARSALAELGGPAVTLAVGDLSTAPLKPIATGRVLAGRVWAQAAELTGLADMPSVA
jgi:NAD(P)-dependent dehydrogenase (short-subunit alcohol dehydrogenase family)